MAGNKGGTRATLNRKCQNNELVSGGEETRRGEDRENWCVFQADTGDKWAHVPASILTSSVVDADDSVELHESERKETKNS